MPAKKRPASVKRASSDAASRPSSIAKILMQARIATGITTSKRPQIVKRPSSSARRLQHAKGSARERAANLPGSKPPKSEHTVFRGLKAYVVNLDSRPDRWKRFASMAKRHLPWLDFERFSATDGTKAPIPEEEVTSVWSTKNNALYGDYSEWTYDAPGTELHGNRWKWACDADDEDPEWIFAKSSATRGTIEKVATKESWKVKKSDKHYRDGVELFMSLGERGCASSHRRLWALAAKRETPTLVFEDDLKLCSPKLRPNGKSDGQQFSARLLLAIERAPTDFDVLYLGWAGFRAGNLKHLSEDNLRAPDKATGSVLRRVEYVWTTVAYVISSAGAQKLLDAARPLNQPVDNFMAWEAREGRLNSFVVLADGDGDDLWNGGIVDQVDFQGDSNIKKSDGGDQGDDMDLFVVGRVSKASA